MPLQELSPHGEEESKHVVEYDQRKTGQVLHAVKPPPVALPPEEARITVHAAVSRISVIYEKLRNAVEYREEHLLRKGAIVRILRRQLLLEADPYVIAHNLIRELIAARYLPNETLPETKVDDGALIVKKYQAIARTNIGDEKHFKWLLGVVATELEETLDDHRREKAVVTYLYEQLSDRIHVRGIELDDMERRLQIYVACYRMLVKADDEAVSYKFLRAYLQEWNKPEAWLDAPEAVAERLVYVHERIQERLKHPITTRFQRAVKPWAVSLWMLASALDEEKEGAYMLSSREETHAAVARVVEKKEKEARAKLRRGTIRAMMYLFITKMVIAFILEVPIEYYLYARVDTFPLAVNVLFPVVLMFFVGILIRRPGSANRMRILQGVDELLAPQGVPAQEIRSPRKRRGLSLWFFRVLYLFMFVASFGIIGSVLDTIGFTIVAIIMFFFFLSLVSFFGYRLRQTAREIIVVKQKERLSTAIMDFFALPILRAGQWLSISISRLNVFAFIFDVLFEAPLKLFLGVLEESLSFIREKKEELTDET